MTTWRRVKSIFSDILNEINNPDIILITTDKWTKILGDKFNEKISGRSYDTKRIITTKYIDQDIVDITDTLWHEILHIIYPNKHHWWIECCAQKLSGSKKKCYYSKKYLHGKCEVPNREIIIQNMNKLLKTKRQDILIKMKYNDRWKGLKNKPKNKKWKFKLNKNNQYMFL